MPQHSATLHPAGHPNNYSEPDTNANRLTTLQRKQQAVEVDVEPSQPIVKRPSTLLNNQSHMGGTLDRQQQKAVSILVREEDIGSAIKWTSSATKTMATMRHSSAAPAIAARRPAWNEAEADWVGCSTDTRPPRRR